VSTTSLVGREGAIDDVVRLLSRAARRLITLTGPGGIGKTRLAVAVAARLHERFDAGTVFVPLEDVTDPGAVVPRIGGHSGLGCVKDREQVLGLIMQRRVPRCGGR
jgi:predicted ATPase